MVEARQARNMEYYHIDISNYNKPIEIIEELKASEFKEDFKVNMIGDNFIAIDSFKKVIEFLSVVFPKSNIMLPEHINSKLIKIVNYYSGKSREQMLEALLNKYNLRQKFIYKPKSVLHIDFSTIQDVKIELPDSTKFNMLNYYETDKEVYYKDVLASDLLYMYMFYSGQDIKIKNESEEIKIPYLKLNKLDLQNIDDQVIQYFSKYWYEDVKHKWIVIEEK